MGCRIVGCGKALPRRAVTNDELSTIVDTDDEWIRTRTGIRTRHVAVGESATDLAASASARFPMRESARMKSTSSCA